MVAPGSLASKPPRVLLAGAPLPLCLLLCVVVTLALLAVVSGALSVTTPCCLPMIPAYLSYVSAAGDGSPAPGARSAALRAALVFVTGFAVVFVILGASLGVVGPVLVRALPEVERVAGVVIVAIGLHLAGVLNLPRAWQAPRLRMAVPAGTRTSGFLLGMAFAVGFVPTLGPVLAAVFTLASSGETVVRGALLLGLYAAGFGVPFVAMALGLHRATTSLAWLRANLGRLRAAGGVLLVAVGLLFITGAWRTFFIPVAARLSRLGWPPI
jgi:cytochrome c-type biogenesis protein